MYIPLKLPLLFTSRLLGQEPPLTWRVMRMLLTALVLGLRYDVHGQLMSLVLLCVGVDPVHTDSCFLVCPDAVNSVRQGPVGWWERRYLGENTWSVLWNCCVIALIVSDYMALWWQTRWIQWVAGYLNLYFGVCFYYRTVRGRLK